MSNTQLPRSTLIRMASVRLLALIPVLFGMCFLPAGTFIYWEGWVFLAILLVPMFLALIYLLRNEPDLLERRMRMREKEREQKPIMTISYICFFLTFLIPGFDKRFEWSNVPVLLVIIADTLVLLGYGVFFLVLRENRYASRIIEVEQGQKVINSGPYAIVRHPMYLAVLLMYILAPLALGSYWAMIPALLVIPILMSRIKHEENVLGRELEGYQEYMQQMKYRLIPGIW